MSDMMTFPDTWEEYERSYGFNDTEEVYTNGARLIPSFRVKQWLDHHESERHGRIFQEIVVEYPSISIYPEYEGKPYFSIKYVEDGQVYIGYGTYKPEVLSEYIKEYFLPSAEPERKMGDWIPCSERLPEEKKEVLISADGELYIAEYEIDRGKGYWSEAVEYRNVVDVDAWMPLPEPWKGEGNDT